MTNDSAPRLRQSVRWGEEYVSRALNIKFAGVIHAGIYRGYKLVAHSAASLLVENGEDCPSSVAVVERDGYSLTVIMNDPGLVQIPAPGEWWICIEAFYAPTQTGYQRIVARERLEAHHVVLGKAYMDENGLRFTDEKRMDAAILTQLDIDAIRQQISGNLADALAGNEALRSSFVALAANLVRVSDRVTRLELAREAGASFSPAAQRLGPEGYQLGDVTVAPVTVVPEGVEAPPGAAFVVKTETLPLNP